MSGAKTEGQDKKGSNSTSSTHKRLLNILKHEDWEEAVRVLDTAVILSQDNGLVDSSGSTSFPTSSTILDCMITACDSSGQIPLHIAIWKRAPDSLIFKLVEACERTVMVKTNNKSTPLHFATFYAASAQVMETLIRKYPLALDEANDYGVTPRTYDLGKLDSQAKELLMRPTSFWLNVFVKDSIAEKSTLKQSIVDKNLQVAALQRQVSKSAQALQQCQASEQHLKKQLLDMQAKVSDSHKHHTLLETLSQSIERSLEESTRLGSEIALSDYGGMAEAINAPSCLDSEDNMEPPAESSIVINASAGGTNNNRNLERRIAYLEEKLADALQALDKNILKRDTVVEYGWVMTNEDPI